VIFDQLFKPKSIAVIGASRDKTSPGYLALYSLLKIGFEGRIYPINPKVNEIFGLKAYHSIEDISREVDLAIIAVSPASVPEILKGCVTKSIKSCIIVASGFGEFIGEEGKKIEEEILTIARNSNIRIVGPNCMGIYCPKGKLAFFPDQAPEAGSLAFISQSGSHAIIFYMLCRERNISFSKVISSGNESDLNCADFLEYLGIDPETKIIAAYLEGVREARRFFEVAKKVSKKKPIIVWKVGSTEAGKKAAASHTGALAGSDFIWNGVFKQTGIILANSLEELSEIVWTFTCLPVPKGRRIAIVSGPGGPAVAAVDACEVFGLPLATLGKETKERLEGVIPRFGTSVLNPVDIGFGGAKPGVYRICVDLVAKDPNVDMIMAIGGAPASERRSFLCTEEFAEEMVEVKEVLDKPLVTILPRALATQKAFKILYSAGIPAYSTPVMAVKSLTALVKHGERRGIDQEK